MCMVFFILITMPYQDGITNHTSRASTLTDETFLELIPRRLRGWVTSCPGWAWNDARERTHSTRFLRHNARRHLLGVRRRTGGNHRRRARLDTGPGGRAVIDGDRHPGGAPHAHRADGERRRAVERRRADLDPLARAGPPLRFLCRRRRGGVRLLACRRPGRLGEAP